MRLCIGTAKGIVMLEPERGPTPVMVLADPCSVWCMAQDCANRNLLYAGSIHNTQAGSARGKGSLARSADGGRSWNDITPRMAHDEEVWAIATAPDGPDEVFVGTSHARLFRSEDGGRNFKECAGFLNLPGRDQWTFPPPPHIPHVRAIAFDPHTPNTLYVGVEEGGIFRSSDRGESFAPLNHGVYSDVHCIAVDSEDPRRIYATTGHGLHVSANGGASWRYIRGLSRTYTIPLMVCDGVDGPIFTAAAGGPPPIWSMGAMGADAMMFRSHDRGHSFQPIASNDGSAHPTRGMAMRFLRTPADGTTFFAALSDGTIVKIDSREDSVTTIADKLPPAFDMVALP